MGGKEEAEARPAIGGVDTHKDLHVAAIVDEKDHVLDTRSFATTRQGYRQMLAWMRSFGALARAGVAAVRWNPLAQANGGGVAGAGSPVLGMRMTPCDPTLIQGGRFHFGPVRPPSA